MKNDPMNNNNLTEDFPELVDKLKNDINNWKIKFVE
jgi:hypothetical protein